MSDEFMGDQPTGDTETTQEKPQAVSTSRDYTDLLAAITNQEGKPKYKTVEDALIGTVNAQSHIQRLEAENSQLRTLSTKVETLEQVLQRLDSTKPKADPQVQPRIEDQEAVVLSVLEKREREQTERRNREAVLNTLREKYKDKIDEVLDAKAQELGLTKAELGALAARSPKAVLAHFESKGAAPSVQGTVNTQALQPRQEATLTPDNILWGASHKDVMNYFRQIKAEVNKELGIN